MDRAIDDEPTQEIPAELSIAPLFQPSTHPLILIKPGDISSSNQGYTVRAYNRELRD